MAENDEVKTQEVLTVPGVGSLSPAFVPARGPAQTFGIDASQQVAPQAEVKHSVIAENISAEKSRR